MSGLPDSWKAEPEPEPDLSRQSDGVHAQAAVYITSLLCSGGDKVSLGVVRGEKFATLDTRGGLRITYPNEISRSLVVSSHAYCNSWLE